jgi:hypothetical protein
VIGAGRTVDGWGPTTTRTTARNQSITAERAAGATLRAIGERHHISPERVRQILIAQRILIANEYWTIYDNGPYQCPCCTHPPYRPPSLLRHHLVGQHGWSWGRASDTVNAMIGRPP